MTLDFKTIINNLRYFYYKHKSDVVAVLIIAVYFSLLMSVMWGYFGSFLYDCGREAYLPQLVLEGKILFKDIFGMYNPLSYQINALLYFFCGKSLNVLFFAGAINALVILLLSYFILRQFIKPKVSIFIVFFLMLLIILNSFKTTNYIFPYAYAMVYALSCFLSSVLFCCLYIKNPTKQYNIVLSFLMLGLSFANKPEFILCIFPLFWVLYRHKVNWNIYIMAILSVCVPTILSYGVMFFQGFTLHDLSDYIIFIQNFFNTSEQHFFNNFISPLNFKIVVLTFFDFIKFILIIALSILFSKLYKAKNNLKYLVMPLCILIIYVYNKLAFWSVYSPDYTYLSWCCLANFLVLYFAIRKKDNLLIFLAACAIVSCCRLHFILKGIYCVYMVILPFLVCVIYFIKYLRIRFIKYADKQIASIFLFIFSFFVFGGYYQIKHVQWIKADTYGQGALYNFADLVEPFNHTVDWVFKNTESDDTIIVLPEGLLINYITDRKTNPKYYHLIPNHISALGEDNIVADLRNNLPDYFILNNASYDNNVTKQMIAYALKKIAMEGKE